MQMASRSSRILLVLLMIVAALSGCGVQGTKDRGDDASPSSTYETNSSEAAKLLSSHPSTNPVSTEEGINTIEIAVYSSDINLENLLERKETIHAGSEADIIAAAVAELQKDDKDNGGISVWKDVHVLSVELTDDAVALDIQIPDEARLGAPGELQMVETLTKTLFQFPFVNSIDVLVSGEALESMMGHVELHHPIVRSF